MREIGGTIFAHCLGLTLLLGACSEPDDTSLADTSLSAMNSSGADSGDGMGPPPPPDPMATAAPEDAAASVAGGPAEIDGITNRRLSFSPGTSSARIEGGITGYETIDYLLNVRAGQAMNISMATPNSATYFNILEPEETEVAIFNGSTSENMFEGLAQKSGDYRIRIYMMRSAARRGEKADFILEAIVD